MKTFQLSDVDCPQVIFECGGQKVESEVIKNVKQNPNFSKPVLYFDIVSVKSLFKMILTRVRDITSKLFSD
jgi:hypothetical protein